MRKRFLALTLAACATVGLLGACASVEPQAYAQEQPALDLRRYFDGRLEGHGMFVERGGKVARRFVVQIRGTWQGDVGTLEEDFVWSDGEKQRRVWTLTPVAGQPGRWSGTAADVRGAALGIVSGNALNWRYTLAVRTSAGKQYDIAFDDWMYLVDERVLLNRAAMSFYGIPVGEVVLSMRRL